MKKAKKLKGAEAIGIKVKVSKSLDKFSDKILFPKKQEIANKVVANLKIK